MISKSTQRMTRGQHGTTWDCWRHEYYSSLSITLSLLSLDRDNTDKKDHGVTCAAAGLEEEPDSQGKMQNHRGQQESCDHVLETFESRWSTWIPSLQETPPEIPCRNYVAHMDGFQPTLLAIACGSFCTSVPRERETQAALFPIWYPEPRLFQASKLSLV